MAGDGLAAALHASGPDPEHAAELRLFGQFIGSWAIEWRGSDPDGHPVQTTGQLDFGWVLGGRAVQDVWRVPGPGLTMPGGRPGFSGSTIRFYDPRIGAWRSTWIDPSNGRVRRFIGRAVDDTIVLEGLDEEPRERWSFRDITPDSFRWVGETSDDGITWIHDEEMIIRRRPG
jgi:hypothetical protein